MFLNYGIPFAISKVNSKTYDHEKVYLHIWFSTCGSRSFFLLRRV